MATRRTPFSIALIVVLTAATLGTGCGGHASRSVGQWTPMPGLAVDPINGLEGAGVLANDNAVITIGREQAGKLGAASLNPRLRRWEFLPDSPLSGRLEYSATWTGKELVVWGGTEPGVLLGDGARYGGHGWQQMASSPLAPRSDHTAVWTGRTVLIWGGALGSVRASNDGAAYDPNADHWVRLADAPIGSRYRHAAVWTGQEMIIWGGVASPKAENFGRAPRFLSDGAAFDPAKNTWRVIAPAPFRSEGFPTAAWTGNRMIVWDGRVAAAYDPTHNAWEMLPKPKLAPRDGSAAVWNNGHLFVWGGTRAGCGDCFLSDGAVYSASTKTWQALPRSPLAPRDRIVGVPLRAGALMWGGCCTGDIPFVDGALIQEKSG
jgi:hypothetical protein